MNTKASSSNWQSDPEGRINNISLAPNPKNTLFPLLESIMNSIQAIEERFGSGRITEGVIEVTFIRSQNGDCVGFRIRDNGVGFNEENLNSFKKMDSQKKVKFGGKGVGRLLWLKVTDHVHIRSTFLNESCIQTVTFDFSLHDPIQNFSFENAANGAEIETTVELHPYHAVYSKEIPKKATTIANRILAHFISYFINISHPKLTIIDGSNEVDLFEQFSSSIERDKDYKFELDISNTESEFVLHCFLLPKSIPDDEKSTNALYLGANGRAVKRFDMDGVFGLKAIDGKFAFLGYVESKTLDISANETRTDFSLSEDELEQIVDTAKEKAKDFLDAEISEIRQRQVNTVTALRNEHPRFLSIARDAESYANKLHLSKQNDEDVFVEMSRSSLREYKRKKNGFLKSVKKKLPDIQQKATEYVNELKEESVSSLAEYVMKRKLILDVFEESLKYTDPEKKKSEYEKVVHDIICPLNSSTDDLNYEDHNLWVVDDRLAFFSYFSSDQQMRKQIKNPENPLNRPDLTVFDLGLGFENTDSSQPITIVEFKRPKRDDYTLESNPISQVRNYVKDMRTSGEAIKFDGEALRTIDEKTPIMCHIIADVTPSLKDMMQQFGPFHQKAGSSSYYKWDDPFSIFIEISSFKEILDSAKARNRAFFEKLGLS